MQPQHAAFATALAMQAKQANPRSDARSVCLFPILFNAPQVRCIMRGHSGPVVDIALTATGALASVSEDATIRIWNPSSGQQTAVLEGHAGPADRLVASPDGKLLASSARDGSVRLWDAASGKTRFAFTGAEEKRHALAFSCDGKLLAVAQEDASIAVYDTATAKEVSQPPSIVLIATAVG